MKNIMTKLAISTVLCGSLIGMTNYDQQEINALAKHKLTEKYDGNFNKNYVVDEFFNGPFDDNICQIYSSKKKTDLIIFTTNKIKTYTNKDGIKIVKYNKILLDNNKTFYIKNGKIYDNKNKLYTGKIKSKKVKVYNFYDKKNGYVNQWFDARVNKGLLKVNTLKIHLWVYGDFSFPG